eukprot:TRINITY_DN42195_c0_g1_i1.p1 TRINITY_DN42195_c0_g1~~TRINITY_DN42195_c0_g1_i1.p1  ORF type:complete len:357 (+),score=39.42 TRINITY_DN42195_c0_g1_i1:128-1198(+)
MDEHFATILRNGADISFLEAIRPTLPGVKAYPEENIFLPSNCQDSLNDLLAKDLLGRVLDRMNLKPSIIQQIMFFVWPERVWLTRVPFPNRRLLKQDFNLLRLHLQNGRTCASKGGLPVSLFFGAPGTWALHLQHLCQSEHEREKDEVFVAHRPEEFALTLRQIVRNGSALRTLRVALDLRNEPTNGARAHGAAALLFALLARGELAKLNHVTVIHAGGDSQSVCESCFYPLTRSPVPLKNLRTLRLSIAKPHIAFKHLASFALQGGLPNLESLVLFGKMFADDDHVTLFEDSIARCPNGSQHLQNLDIRASNAGVLPVKVLMKLQHEGRLPNLSRCEEWSAVLLWVSDVFRRQRP